MTHDKLLAKIERQDEYIPRHPMRDALRAVVQLHKHKKIRLINYCGACTKDELVGYPCPTIEAIEKELK